MRKDLFHTLLKDIYQFTKGESEGLMHNATGIAFGLAAKLELYGEYLKVLVKI